MSADVAARLRLLAQDHHDGRLDLAAYRALRAPLLDSLVLNVAAVASAMEITQPRAAVRPTTDDATTRPGKLQTPPAAVSNAWTSAVPQQGGGAPTRAPVRAIVVGVVLIAAAAVAVWMWRAPVADGGASQAVTAGTQDHIADLVGQFVDRGDWSDGRLASLNAALLELGGAQIATVAREAWFQRFVDELRRRLKEQQALASSALTVDNSPLAALAVTVGLDLNSPDAAIHIAALPAPPPAEEVAAATSAAERATNHAGVHRSAGEHEDGATGTGSATTSPLAAESAAGQTLSGAQLSRSNSSTPNGAVTAGESPTGAAATPTNASGSAAAGDNACRLQLVQSRRPLCHDTLPAGAEAPLMALVPAGTFDMGSPATAEEQPVHRVTLRDPFAISVYEISQGDFKQFCEQTSRTCAKQPWSGDDYPVVNVSWDDARAYADWLSSVTHHRYSLPTEAQWEYAARAGQTGLFPSGDTLSPTDAHYSMLAKQTTPARRSEKFKANAFRLVHVVGNVREWVEDGWTPNFASAPADGSAAKPAPAAARVARGGSYTDGAARLRLSMREGLPAGTRDPTTGFRIVRELP